MTQSPPSTFSPPLFLGLFTPIPPVYLFRMTTSSPTGGLGWCSCLKFSQHCLHTPTSSALNFQCPDLNASVIVGFLGNLFVLHNPRLWNPLTPTVYPLSILPSLRYKLYIQLISSMWYPLTHPPYLLSPIKISLPIHVPLQHISPSSSCNQGITWNPLSCISWSNHRFVWLSFIGHMCF